MQSDYAACFERDMGRTEAEWLGWLPAAVGNWPWQQVGQEVRVALAGGQLRIAWRPEAPRLIGLIRIPRLIVQFSFSSLNGEQRRDFMKRFDLYMQRGGG